MHSATAAAAVGGLTVDLWVADLDGLVESGAADPDTLSPSEKLRATKWIFPRDRERYVAGRTFLRSVLSDYLGIAPDRVPISLTPEGKPELARGMHPEPVSFNLSHSNGMIAIVVGKGGAIGIDLEAITDLPERDRLFCGLSSPTERILYENLPQQTRTEAFFRWWTCKEALLKGLGHGLKPGLNGFSVDFRPDRQPAILAGSSHGLDLRGWRLCEAEPPTGFALAIACESHGCPVSIRRRVPDILQGRSHRKGGIPS